MSELEELQKASAGLQRCRNELRVLMESSSPESEEAVKAELGVAKAKLGVAEAKLGVAEAELYEAKRKEATPERQSEIAKAEMGVVKAEMGVVKAEMGVAKAEWDVAIAAYNAEAKNPITSTERLRSLQDQIDARKETYKRLEGQLSFVGFRSPNGST
jgi:chromosome segregation ATPase